jgi:hypothetical protein
MPIDDALEQLEGAPRHILKEPELVISATLEDIKEKYKEKFTIVGSGSGWVKISFDAHEFFPKRSFQFFVKKTNSVSYTPIDKLDKNIYLKEKDKGTIKGVHYLYGKGHYMYLWDNKLCNPQSLNKEKKKEIRDWAKNVTKRVFSEIPELEDFLNNYNANR